MTKKAIKDLEIFVSQIFYNFFPFICPFSSITLLYHFFLYVFYPRHLPTPTPFVKDKDKPEDRQGAVYKIKCCDCQASHLGENGRNLSTRLTEHKRATRNGDVNNHIAEHYLKTKYQIDWDSATCVTYSTDFYQRLTLESWFTNLEQTPLNRSQQLPAPYKRLIDEIKQN